MIYVLITLSGPGTYLFNFPAVSDPSINHPQHIKLLARILTELESLVTLLKKLISIPDVLKKKKSHCLR